ncbi:MAG TPA: carboxypeptidase M32 [Cellvibrionaceae bacterium]|nr:carboxypeptidase M32 [Cellvibrionaceae bacterium]HMW49017.1 carboxypeptidase M32 [Cellvibrionaceae bacterium]HMW71523.1 carboxypeptidase M32 [Cellvibrionaceae bacterium]HMY39344.1 carboxypeptidase M32 [Marinagarivorans sp.]HNG60288.1 carboxypeptidase M32 [Cellvibrionaceae bacterium]
MSYKQLHHHFTKISHYNHLSAICSWDQSAMMPAGGNAARGEAMAELAVLIHQNTTAPQLAEWIKTAEQEQLTPQQQASLAAIKRRWQQASQVPEDLVQAQSLATSTCEHAWREQRKNNDWAGFKPNLEAVVKLAREEAGVRAAGTLTHRYDALLELYEPGMTASRIDEVFGAVKTWLPEFITKALDIQSRKTIVAPQGPFAVPQQKELGMAVMQLLGFDFNHGRLDVSTHPFCGGVPSDVRITTRYDESDFMKALLGVIHETGHARYEQNLPIDWRNLPVGEARSMGVHESQSLFFEMQLARSAEFSQLIAPLAAKILGRQDDPAFNQQNLYAYNTRIKRGFIRVDADELTYPAHVILRYEIERALIEGDIEVADIPDLWGEKMQAYLGLSTVGNFKDGCMQDIHWPLGSFGYFPSYTLGAMYAAQLFNAAKQVIPKLSDKISAGDLAPLFAWLNEHIWAKASFMATDDLIAGATGEPLNAKYFKQHLEQRYLQTL